MVPWFRNGILFLDRLPDGWDIHQKRNRNFGFWQKNKFRNLATIFEISGWKKLHNSANTGRIHKCHTFSFLDLLVESFSLKIWPSNFWLKFHKFSKGGRHDFCKKLAKIVFSWYLLNFDADRRGKELWFPNGVPFWNLSGNSRNIAEKVSQKFIFLENETNSNTLPIPWLLEWKMTKRAAPFELGTSSGPTRNHSHQSKLVRD